MKIVHICLSGSYNDNWGYHDNLLPKYNKKAGHDVTVITSIFVNSKKHRGYEKVNPGEYVLDDGVKVIRIPFKKIFAPKLAEKLRTYEGLYKKLEKERPDFIFIHGIQFLDVLIVAKYLKNNPNCKAVADNHADFMNSARNWLSRNVLHRIIWKRCAALINPYVTKFYGVTPARVDFLVNMYNLPKQKVELLAMGADDEKVEETKNENIRKQIRKRYNINPDDFLIMTGGKIDTNKPQTLLLMEAVKKLNYPKVKLLIFGSVVPELKEKFNCLISDNIKYIGWVDSKDTYNYFSAADLIVFPGLHSVFWEQVVGLGKPCIFKYIQGFTHIDLNGNCKFIYRDSVDEIKDIISEIINNNKLYEQMKKIAESRGKEIFSYKRIANKSLE